MSNNLDYTKMITIITGGGRGIGRQIAFKMAAQGTSILLIGRTQDSLEETRKAISSAHPDIYVNWLVGDVSNPKTAREALFLCKTYFPHKDINLVLNAGYGKSGPIESFEYEEWQRIFNVNVNGVFNFVKEFLPLMKEYESGSISIISSLAGLKGIKNDSAYSASKFAVNGLAESLYYESRSYNISVACICPGYVAGEMTNKSIAKIVEKSDASWEEAEKIIASRNSQNRILGPEEVAEAVLYNINGLAHKNGYKPILLEKETDHRILRIVNWIYQNTNKARSLLIPVSGGSDSALVGLLCGMARSKNQLAVSVYWGDSLNLRCWEWFAQNKNLYFISYINYNDRKVESETDRWSSTIQLANHYNAWIVGSRNKTEETLGTYSILSSNATVLPLAGLWKSEVMELCKLLNIPDEIIESSRKADPECGRPLELAEIPLEIIDAYLQGAKLDNKSQMDYLDKIKKLNSFRANLPLKGPTSETRQK